MIKLFISYRSLDSAKVDVLVARIGSLTNSDGTQRYQIWQDKHSIPAGQDWWQAIVQGIMDCDVFVFMISEESAQNINCRDELTYARKRNRPIIPIVLDGEFYFNPDKAKHDLDYWQHMPQELNDTRFQFLFYDGDSFVQQLNDAVDRLMTLGLKDIPADFPPDPRDATSTDTITIYDQACDYALRLEFETARQKFQRLMDWNDELFADDAHAWMVLLYEYEKLVRLDERKNTRHRIPPLWTDYAAKFPKHFIDLFDPKDFKSRYIAPESDPKAPLQVIQPPQARLLNPIEEAEAIARAFKGTENSNWTPIIKTFELHGIEFEMCLVPPGSFMMGSDDYDNEKPVHKQTLTQPYWIGVYPVTNAQWRRVVELSNGAVKIPSWADWYHDSDRVNHPVVGVTWYQCSDFVSWLGSEWRLPTELEWEYAARGLDNLVYPFGNDFKPELVVYGENSSRSTAAVGARRSGASWVGAQDMIGNVWEWTASIYKAYPYKTDDRREDKGPKGNRVLRGGSWKGNYSSSRTVSRFLNRSSNHSHDFGFRLLYRIPSS